MKRKIGMLCLSVGALALGAALLLAGIFAPPRGAIRTQGVVVQAGERPVFAVATPLGNRRAVAENGGRGLRVGDVCTVFYDGGMNQVFYPPVAHPWQLLLFLFVEMGVFLLTIGFILLLADWQEKRKKGGENPRAKQGAARGRPHRRSGRSVGPPRGEAP